MTQEALKAAEILAAENIDVRVVNMGTIKPLDGETVLTRQQKKLNLVTAEEHSVIGGLGSGSI